MEMIKNKILALLLFTFAFFVMHDYIIEDLHHGIKYELSYETCDKIDIQNKVHSTIHNIFNFNLEEILFVEEKLLDTPPSSIILTLSSTTNPVLQKPPLS